MAGFSDNFQGQDIEGNLYDKQIALESLEKSISIAQTLRSRTRLQKVTLVGGEAIVLTKEHTELRIMGQRTGKLHSLIFDGNWSSVWVKENDVWKVRVQKQLSQTITKNGVSRFVAPKAAKMPNE